MDNLGMTPPEAENCKSRFLQLLPLLIKRVISAALRRCTYVLRFQAIGTLFIRHLTF
jgi:hypothetical protein